LQYTHVGILIFDSVTGQPVPSATFKVDGSSVPVQYPQEGVLTNLGPEGFGGGYPMLQVSVLSKFCQVLDAARGNFLKYAVSCRGRTRGSLKRRGTRPTV
jgi:hypothetical protein